MIAVAIPLIASVVIGLILGLCLPPLLQLLVSKLLGGNSSLIFSRNFRLLYVRFEDASQLKDWQIRVSGLSKILVPGLLFLYFIAFHPTIDEIEWVVLVTLLAGLSRISWTDLLAIENPKEWSLEVTHAYRRHEKEPLLPDYLPKSRDRHVTYISFLILLSFCVLVVLEHEGLVNYLSNDSTPPYEVDTLAQVVGGIGSVLFSAILVILYDKQTSISNIQSETQREQGEIMRRGREPRLSGPYNFKFWGSYPPRQSNREYPTNDDMSEIRRDPNPNSVQFFQTNAGEGLAQNFRLQVLLQVDIGPHEGMAAVCAVQRMDRFPLRKFGESDIQGGEKDVEFLTEELKLQFTEPNSGDNGPFSTYKFKQGVNKLCSEGTCRISITLRLEWENEFEERESEQVYHTSSDIEPGMDLLDIVG